MFFNQKPRRILRTKAGAGVQIYKVLIVQDKWSNNWLIMLITWKDLTQILIHTLTLLVIRLRPLRMSSLIYPAWAEKAQLTIQISANQEMILASVKDATRRSVQVEIQNRLRPASHFTISHERLIQEELHRLRTYKILESSAGKHHQMAAKRQPRLSMTAAKKLES